MNRILVDDQTGQTDAIANLLQRRLTKALRELNLTKVELSVALVDDQTITDLNDQYRGSKRPTDVLSFSQDGVEETGGKLLGDIIISIPTARRQADSTAHSLERECTILGLHGFLHLLGHDHEEEAEARTMFEIQDRLLKKVEAIG